MRACRGGCINTSMQSVHGLLQQCSHSAVKLMFCASCGATASLHGQPGCCSACIAGLPFAMPESHATFCSLFASERQGVDVPTKNTHHLTSLYRRHAQHCAAYTHVDRMIASKDCSFQVALEEARQGPLADRLRAIDAVSMEKHRDLTAAAARTNREGNKGTRSGHD